MIKVFLISVKFTHPKKKKEKSFVLFCYFFMIIVSLVRQVIEAFPYSFDRFSGKNPALKFKSYMRKKRVIHLLVFII